MSKPLSFGLNLAKKPGTAKKPTPPKRKPMFGGDDDSDDDDASNNNTAQVQEIGGDLDSFDTPQPTETAQPTRKAARGKPSGPPSQPPRPKGQGAPNTMFGDLSSALTSRRNAEAAAAVDASVYEYDGVYESLKPAKKAEADGEGQDRRPRYMRGLLDAAEVRKRDALVAEEKKIARDREAEGDEYEGKEKFVTGAYRRQQEENRRLEEEEKRREEEEAKGNKGGGMSGFYRNLLDRDEQRHSAAVQAAEQAAKAGPAPAEEAKEGGGEDEEDPDKARVEELKKKGADIAVNEDGQIVDKRQLLRGGLNVAPKPKSGPKQADSGSSAKPPDPRDRRQGAGANFGPGSSKQAMRERQSRMMAEQLEQSAKRARDEAEAQRAEVEHAAKSRKTEGEISSAKERYLARKRAAEEAKKQAGA